MKKLNSLIFVEPRKTLPPLLVKLSERQPEHLDYIAVSFGLTQELLKFWKRADFVPVYIRYCDFLVRNFFFKSRKYDFRKNKKKCNAYVFLQRH